MSVMKFLANHAAATLNMTKKRMLFIDFLIKVCFYCGLLLFLPHQKRKSLSNDYGISVYNQCDVVRVNDDHHTNDDP